MNGREYGIWVFTCTEREQLFCAAFFIAAYIDYRLSYVPPDVISFASELCMGMADALGEPTESQIRAEISAGLRYGGIFC